jgi:flagellar biosynthesis protein FlhG
VAPLCGLAERSNIADVLAARRDIHEALEPGPGGIQVLPGIWAPAEITPLTAPTIDRVLHQLRSLGRHAEVVVMDVGASSGELARRFWTAADFIVLITTSDDMAVMDAYAAIKTLGAGTEAGVHVIVNQVADEARASSVIARLAHSCQRFLARHIEPAGWLPQDPQVPEAAGAKVPFLLAAPQGPAAIALATAAQHLQSHTARKDLAASR